MFQPRIDQDCHLLVGPWEMVKLPYAIDTKSSGWQQWLKQLRDKRWTELDHEAKVCVTEELWFEWNLCSQYSQRYLIGE